MSFHSNSKAFEFNGMERLGCSAREYITNKIERKIDRAKANTFPDGTLSECQEQLRLAEKYFLPEFDDAPHVLVHGDLSANTIIVHKDFDVERWASSTSRVSIKPLTYQIA